MNALLYPVFALVILTLSVTLALAYQRLSLLRAKRIDPQTTATRSQSAQVFAPIANYSDNLQNLFEYPVLFYTLIAFILIAGKADSIYVAGSWAFVGLRALHSLIHCSSNNVTARFSVFLVSTALLVVLWIRFAWAFL